MFCFPYLLSERNLQSSSFLKFRKININYSAVATLFTVKNSDNGENLNKYII